MNLVVNAMRIFQLTHSVTLRSGTKIMTKIVEWCTFNYLLFVDKFIRILGKEYDKIGLLFIFFHIMSHMRILMARETGGRNRWNGNKQLPDLKMTSWFEHSTALVEAEKSASKQSEPGGTQNSNSAQWKPPLLSTGTRQTPQRKAVVYPMS